MANIKNQSLDQYHQCLLCGHTLHAGDVLLKPIVANAGKDISHWFDPDTKDVSEPHSKMEAREQSMYVACECHPSLHLIPHV